MNKNVLVSAGVALLVVVLGLAFFGRSSVERVIERVTETKVGAIPGNEVQSNIFKIAGSPLVGISQTFETGTTSVCSLDVRGYASSSILSLGATVEGLPTTTGLSWQWYKGVGRKSTTTIMAGQAVTATGTSVFATTTIAANQEKVIEAGENFLVLDFQGGSTPYFGMEGRTGQCSVLLHTPAAR